MLRPRSEPDVLTLSEALRSPLRLHIVSELLRAPDCILSLDDAVVLTGRHLQDVLACLEPLGAMGVLRRVGAGAAWQLAPDLAAPLRAVLDQAVRDRGELIERGRRVRTQVLCGMIGVDAKMQVVFETVHQLARLDIPVLITGETGTGKELVARAVHELSPRRTYLFGDVNCATLTEDLFASEMFGHARGAFTGAVKDHVGLFERCHRGTVFLDEIGDLGLANQVKLLRVLQGGILRRVGDSVERRPDFRLICATNRDLEAMVADGSFREDLYYRINVFPLRVPSLRERPDDVPYLAEQLLTVRLRAQHGPGPAPGVTPAALAALRAHSWPGNVRELENVLMRALVRAEGGPIDVRHLPELRARRSGAGAHPPSSGVLLSLAEAERVHIEKALSAHGGQVAAAARALGISRTTLYAHLRRYGIDAPTSEPGKAR